MAGLSPFKEELVKSKMLFVFIQTSLQNSMCYLAYPGSICTHQALAIHIPLTETQGMRDDQLSMPLVFFTLHPRIRA